VDPERKNKVVFTTPTYRERSRNIFLVTCSLQFAKAGSAATLPQQEKKNSVDVQRGRVNIAGFICNWQMDPRGDVPSASSSR
jgi:hypothetical protein